MDGCVIIVPQTEPYFAKPHSAFKYWSVHLHQQTNQKDKVNYCYIPIVIFDKIQVEAIWKGITPSLLTPDDLSFGSAHWHIGFYNLSVGLHVPYCQDPDHTIYQEASAGIHYRSESKHCVLASPGMDWTYLENYETITQGSNENISSYVWRYMEI